MKLKLFLAISAGVLFMAGSVKLNAPRGIRNNNPGNIRENDMSDFEWLGEASSEWDAEFEEFSSPEYGIRAIGKILDTYRKKYGIETVAGIISRWAPSNENDTSAYIRSVEKQTGIDAGAIVDRSDYPALVKAIIKHENGVQPYTDAQIISGLGMV